jgi:acetyl esterase/lipase
MKIPSLFPVVCLLWAGAAAAAAEPAPTLNLWPGPAPGEAGGRGPERVRLFTSPQPKKQVSNVSVPGLEIYRPVREKDTGTAIIVCPGGGFNVLEMDYEGEDCAAWLSSIGVTGIVLKYRLPPHSDLPNYFAGLQDAQRALRLVRSKAAAWGLDPHRIGILGFSAGGQLAALAATTFDEPSYPAGDAVDQVSCRPDFAVDVYPGGLARNGRLIPELRVGPDTPPTFIAIADRDATEGSALLYLALKRAGVSAELHIYSDGAHGFGVRAGTEPHTTWTARLTDWMTQRGLLRPAAPAT